MDELDRRRIWSILNGYVDHTLITRAQVFKELLEDFKLHGMTRQMEESARELSNFFYRAANALHVLANYFDTAAEEVTLADFLEFVHDRSIDVQVPAESPSLIVLCPFEAVVLRFAVDNLLDNAMAAVERLLRSEGSGRRSLLQVVLRCKVDSDAGNLDITVENPGTLPEGFIMQDAPARLELDVRESERAHPGEGGPWRVHVAQRTRGTALVRRCAHELGGREPNWQCDPLPLPGRVSATLRFPLVPRGLRLGLRARGDRS